VVLGTRVRRSFVRRTASRPFRASAAPTSASASPAP